MMGEYSNEKMEKQTVVNFSRYYWDIFLEGRRKIKKATTRIFGVLTDVPTGYVQSAIHVTADLIWAVWSFENCVLLINLYMQGC
jgi:hypothetical protein